MSISFQLSERLAGFVASPAKKGEPVSVMCAESLTSLQGVQLTWRLEELHNAVFAKIPGLPDPSLINNLLVVINPDLSATAYVNELSAVAGIKPARPLQAGEPVLVSDILDILSYNIGIEVPDSAGVILVRSHGWRKALYYDLCPLGVDAKPRAADISSILAKQTLALLRGQFAEAVQNAAMKRAIAELEDLIQEKSNDESEYQEFLRRNPWFLGGMHIAIDRHSALDDQNIPDFTGVRAADKFRDIFEIKPPFMPCFRADGGFTAPFNDAWSQAERYLDFARRQRQYLRDKGLEFENPRCFLLAGYGLTTTERQALRVKEAFNPAITIVTYEELLAIARASLALMESAST